MKEFKKNDLETWNEEQEDRLELLAITKLRGKGAPKKKREKDSKTRELHYTKGMLIGRDSQERQEEVMRWNQQQQAFDISRYPRVDVQQFINTHIYNLGLSSRECALTCVAFLSYGRRLVSWIAQASSDLFSSRCLIEDGRSPSTEDITRMQLIAAWTPAPESSTTDFTTTKWATTSYYREDCFALLTPIGIGGPSRKHAADSKMEQLLLPRIILKC